MLGITRAQPGNIKITSGIFVPDPSANSSSANGSLLWSDNNEDTMNEIYDENDAVGLIPHNTGKILISVVIKITI